MTVEERLDQLEKRNKRLTAALTLMAVAICAVVTVAATGDKDGEFDTVYADRVIAKTGIQTRSVYATNDAGDLVVSLGANDGGDGLVVTYSAKGKELVTLSSTVENEGTVTTYQSNGKELVDLTAGENGGGIQVFNKTGEGIVDLRSDEYGNGYIGAWDRKGKGRTLQPWP